MSVIDRENAEHYVWGGECDGWHLLKRQDLSVIAERVPAGKSEIRHRHTHARQLFYVLSGEAVIEREGTAYLLCAGQALEVAPGVAHQFRNETSEDVHFLVVSHPSTRGDRVDD